MTRCATCLKPFATKVVDGTVVVIEKAIRVHDDERGKDLYVHTYCDPAKVITKAQAEAAAEERERNPPMREPKMEIPPVV